jgi:hypothetical protein
MSVTVSLWLFGALMALFFAWILGHMQRGDARIRTERMLGLEERAVPQLVPGEVNAMRGTLAAAAGSEPLSSPIDGTPCLFFDALLTREGSVRGTPQPLETVHQERRLAETDLRGVAPGTDFRAPATETDSRVRLQLEGALLHPRDGVVTREAAWRDGEWSADAWQAAGWLDGERRYVEALGVELPGALDAGMLRLRYEQLRPGDEALVIGEVSRDAVARVTTLGSSPRFQLELTSGSLADYQRAQLGAHRAMQRASRGFVGLAAVLVALAGLTFAGVLS